jgi:pimeloyl-ACP methyl ester carboxylesterase
VTGALEFGRAGEGEPPVVLLHGFGADRLSWFLTVPEIAGDATIYALDLPGHGTCAAPIGDGGIVALGEAVAALIEREAIGAATIVGHSLGGAVALQLADRRPDLVRSLVLIAPAGLGAGIDPAFLADFIAMQDAEQATAVLRRLVEEPRLISRQMAAGVLRQLAVQGARERLAAIARHLDGVEDALAPVRARVAGLPFPRTVVWGRRDRVNPLHRDRAAALGGDLVLFDGVGHCPHLERSARDVGALIRKSIARQR